MSTSSYYRIEALQHFEGARRRAQFCRLGMKLANRPLNLIPFAPIHDQLPITNGIPRGVQQVPLAQIVGSLGWASDFDRLFRPLHDGQRDRWVNMWVMQQLGGWDPIMVRQIGNLYFVEDGHHRTSVARASGLLGITADVIEYPIPLHFDTHASLATILVSLEKLAMTDVFPVVCG
jgi:hypothetical protein